MGISFFMGFFWVGVLMTTIIGKSLNPTAARMMFVTINVDSY
jgi:hypothetical protein